MWELISENLTGLGGPMGTERTWTNFRKFFKSIENAKKFAESDYGSGRKFPWRDGKNNCLHSPDLGFVMYHIRPVITED